jgi:hypothetical protein
MNVSLSQFFPPALCEVLIFHVNNSTIAFDVFL